MVGLLINYKSDAHTLRVRSLSLSAGLSWNVSSQRLVSTTAASLTLPLAL